MFVLSSSGEIDDVIKKVNLRQSAFCIEIFDADIQIPERSLQALFPFFIISRPHPEIACSQATLFSVVASD